MSKTGIQLYFEGANTSWVMDAEKIDEWLQEDVVYERST